MGGAYNGVAFFRGGQCERTNGKQLFLGKTEVCTVLGGGLWSLTLNEGGERSPKKSDPPGKSTGRLETGGGHEERGTSRGGLKTGGPWVTKKRSAPISEVSNLNKVSLGNSPRVLLHSICK